MLGVGELGLDELDVEVILPGVEKASNHTVFTASTLLHP